MTTTHLVSPQVPGRTLCCHTEISELPASAALVFQPGQGVTCPNVNTADNLHLALAQALNRPSSTSNRELVKEVTGNRISLAGYRQAAADVVIELRELRDRQLDPDDVVKLNELIQALGDR